MREQGGYVPGGLFLGGAQKPVWSNGNEIMHCTNLNLFGGYRAWRTIARLHCRIGCSVTVNMTRIKHFWITILFEIIIIQQFIPDQANWLHRRHFMSDDNNNNYTELYVARVFYNPSLLSNTVLKKQLPAKIYIQNQTWMHFSKKRWHYFKQHPVYLITASKLFYFSVTL